jgi:dTDP-4-dehydrorhamnose 3,5-epimerase
MEILKTNIEGALLIKPKIFGDSRGYFFEFYSEKEHDFLSENEKFVQDNQSMSHANVLRGLHMQQAPFSQGKFVRVITGAVLDVVVDARKNSPTFGKHLTEELSSENHHMLYIPAGCLHGFTTLKDNTIFTYKCTNYYNKESEITVSWNDPALGIDWKCLNPIISDKDTNGISFKDYIEKFT